MTFLWYETGVIDIYVKTTALSLYTDVYIKELN